MLGKSTYFVDFAPFFGVGRRASDTGEASKEPLGEGVDRISRGFLDDLSAARSDVETEEILHGCQIGSVNPFTEAVVPGTGLVGGREPSLDGVFLHF